jgi:hypothetical protein
MKIIAGVLCSMLFILYGCGLTGAETTPPASGIYIVNVSPGSSGISVSVNSTTLANNYTYGKDSGYFLLAPGTYNFKVSSTDPIADSTDLLNIPAGKYYSLFFVDYPASLKAEFIEDKLSSDTFSYANIRLFDFSPNSQTVNAFFANKDTSASTDTVLFQSRHFNDQVGHTNFIAVSPGTYNFSIYKTDSAAALIKNFDSLNFATGHYYTVYMKGLDSNTTTPLDKAVIEH